MFDFMQYMSALSLSVKKVYLSDMLSDSCEMKLKSRTMSMHMAVTRRETENGDLKGSI